VKPNFKLNVIINKIKILYIYGFQMQGVCKREKVWVKKHKRKIQNFPLKQPCPHPPKPQMGLDVKPSEFNFFFLNYKHFRQLCILHLKKFNKSCSNLYLMCFWGKKIFSLQEAIELMVACSAMAVAKEEASKEETKSPKSKWAKWKRGGIIGAAAITGGTLLAITGGMKL